MNKTKFAKDFRLWLLKIVQNQGRLGRRNGIFIIKYRQGADSKNAIDWEERAEDYAHQFGATNSGVYFLGNQNYHVLDETSLKNWYTHMKNKDNLEKFATAMAGQDGIPVYVNGNKVYNYTIDRANEKVLYTAV